MPRRRQKRGAKNQTSTKLVQDERNNLENEDFNAADEQGEDLANVSLANNLPRKRQQNSDEDQTLTKVIKVEKEPRVIEIIIIEPASEHDVVAANLSLDNKIQQNSDYVQTSSQIIKVEKEEKPFEIKIEKIDPAYEKADEIALIPFVEKVIKIEKDEKPFNIKIENIDPAYEQGDEIALIPFVEKIIKVEKEEPRDLEIENLDAAGEQGVPPANVQCNKNSKKKNKKKAGENKCFECNNQFKVSKLLKHFGRSVCNDCQNNHGKYAFITKTRAKHLYFLGDKDLGNLEYIECENPHYSSAAPMRLYLTMEVEERAIAIWGSKEKLEQKREIREERRQKRAQKKAQKLAENPPEINIRENNSEEDSSSSYEVFRKYRRNRRCYY